MGKKQKHVGSSTTKGGVIPTNLSAMSKHAIVELSLIKEEPKIVLWYVSVLEAYNIMQLTEEASDHCLETLTRLIRYENLAPLTDEPMEWVKVGDDIWQSIRNYDAYSNNGGKTFKLHSENNDVEHATMKMEKEDVES
jgi:hypothetical protein